MGSILVVEADPETRGHWTAALEGAGHEVVIANGTRDGLELLRGGGIGAVVLDSYDPRAGAIELARGLDALPDAAPIVLVSSSPHAPEISARIGAAAFLPKPCLPGEVVEAVARLFGELRPLLALDAIDDDEPDGPTTIHRPFTEPPA